jgi:uncharacterized protein YyaL (SSP411 family)
LGEALRWLYRAQDANRDHGVSHSFLIGKGWLPSYPETSGYIIPTLLNHWKLSQADEARLRAIDMANWALGIQLPNGAVPSLATGEPVVFDTGQVIFGWLSAFKVADQDRFLDAATRAGDWLVEALDPDGAWRQWTGSTVGITYNARTAWALLELALLTKDERYRRAARRFLDWTLKQERDEGWFEYNCLNDNNQPLLHTIAYTARGQLESGILLDAPEFIAAAERTAVELSRRVAPDGRMAGRFDRHWEPTVKWACLTGMAQISLVWSGLERITGDSRYRVSADAVISFLKTTQDLRSKNPGLRGGIRGSFPVNGQYCRYRIPNWAVKFFIDALMQASNPNSPRAIFKG